MKLFLYQLRYKVWVLGVLGLFVHFLVLVRWGDPFLYYHQSMEVFPSILIALLSTLILTSDTENEFAKCYGISWMKLGFAQWLPNLLYPLIIAVLSCPYQARMLYADELLFEGKAYFILLFSLFASYFLAAAIGLFIRVLVRNTHVAFTTFLIVLTPFYTLHHQLSLKKVPLELARYDIWLTGFFYSEEYHITMDIWLCNRVITVIIAILFIIGAYFLLKQKRYKNFN